MADISNDIRLAVDSGVTRIGIRSVVKSVKKNEAKLVIAASKNKAENLGEIEHLAKVAGIRFIRYESNPVELGTVCGKPFSVSMLSIVNPGNSKILDNLETIGE